MIKQLNARLPSLRASVLREYGTVAFLFGIDLSPVQFACLADDFGVGSYERNQPIILDGVKILPGDTLEPGRINAVVAVPGSLIVRPTVLEPPAAYMA